MQNKNKNEAKFLRVKFSYFCETKLIYVPSHNHNRVRIQNIQKLRRTGGSQ